MYTRISYLLVLLLGLNACVPEGREIIEPLSLEDYPQIIVPADGGDGDVEDADELSIKIELVDRVDPEGEALDGTIVPLTSDATVRFALSDAQGFSQWSTYLLGWEAFYEIDDCTTSADQGESLDLVFDPATGEGSLTFPAGVEEVELVFEVDPSLFDDGVLNTETRGFSFHLTELSSPALVRVNQELSFEYEVLDDDALYGSWMVDVSDSSAFAAFQAIFGLVNSDIAALSASLVDEIELEFKYDELSLKVVLIEEELLTDCDGIDVLEALEIELDMEYAELETATLSGAIELEGSVELEDGSEPEFSYEGSFNRQGNSLSLELSGEYEDESVDAIVLPLLR